MKWNLRFPVERTATSCIRPLVLLCVLLVRTVNRVVILVTLLCRSFEYSYLISLVMPVSPYPSILGLLVRRCMRWLQLAVGISLCVSVVRLFDVLRVCNCLSRLMNLVSVVVGCGVNSPCVVGLVVACDRSRRCVFVTLLSPLSAAVLILCGGVPTVCRKVVLLLGPVIRCIYVSRLPILA